MGRISQFTLHCSLCRTSYLKVWKASYIMSGYIELVHINKFNIHSLVHLMYISIGKNNQGHHESTYSFGIGSSSSFDNCFTSATVAKLGLIPGLCLFCYDLSLSHLITMDYFFISNVVYSATHSLHHFCALLSFSFVIVHCTIHVFWMTHSICDSFLLPL